MRKITLLIALLCSVLGFSKRIYIQLGTEGSPKWTVSVAEPDSLIDLTVKGKSLQVWHREATGLVAGDEIWIAGGTYITDPAATLPTATAAVAITVKNGVNVYGGFAGTETSISQRAKGANPWDYTNATILSGNNVSTVAGFTSTPGLKFGTLTEATIVDGLTIQNYVRNGGNSPGCAVTMGTFAVMQNCIIKDNLLTFNVTANGGCGVVMQSDQPVGYPVLENCYIYNNNTDRSGGTTGSPNGGGGLIQGYALVKGCVIENNSALGLAGGIYINWGGTRSGGATIEDCIFKNNVSPLSGGGLNIIIKAGTTASEAIKNCQFIGNISGTSAGGLITDANTNVLLEGCSFIGNKGATAGGAQVSAATLMPIKNCLFEGNTSTGEGGAITLGKGTTTYNCIFANNKGRSAVYLNAPESKIYNCTFANNDTIALKIVATATACEVKNNIFWGNTDNTVTGGDAPSFMNNGYSGATGADSGTGTITTLTVSPNNTFVLPTTFVGSHAIGNAADSLLITSADWKIRTGSPTIDAGTDLSAMQVMTDIIGADRPAGAGYDLGAYEGSVEVSGTKNVVLTNAKVSVRNAAIVVESTDLSAVSVYNMSGMNMYRSNIDNYIHQVQLNKGIYLVQVMTSAGISTQKVVLY